MSQITAGHAHGHAHGHGHGPDRATLLAHDNVHAPGFGKGLAAVLLGVGLLGVVGVAAYALTGDAKAAKHALASYHVGALIALGLSLGPLGLVMILHAVQAGWAIGLRRQAENLVALVPAAVLLLLPSVVFSSKLFKWMDPALAQTDYLLQHKQGFLNQPFFYARVVLYAAVWITLSRLMVGYSIRQDQTGDKQLSAKARFTSCWGLLAFALTTAFASFDFIKALDFHWFSTMFGVYFFAGNMLSGLCLVALVTAALLNAGKLRGVVTGEHFHDLGKLIFSFTIFWAYIAFSQYFLIWYANIPEETAWLQVRGAGGTPNEWTPLFYTLCFGHFLAPFLLLIFRDVKRTPMTLAFMAGWLLTMHALDVFWLVRPIIGMTEPEGRLNLAWVDAAGLLGPLAIFLGLVLRRVAATPLVPLKDPRLHESLEHKNYV